MLLIFFLFTAINIASLCISYFFSCLSNKVSEVFLGYQQIIVLCAFLVSAKSSAVLRQKFWFFQAEILVPWALIFVTFKSYTIGKALIYLFTMSRRVFITVELCKKFVAEGPV